MARKLPAVYKAVCSRWWRRDNKGKVGQQQHLYWRCRSLSPRRMRNVCGEGGSDENISILLPPPGGGGRAARDAMRSVRKRVADFTSIFVLIFASFFGGFLPETVGCFCFSRTAGRATASMTVLNKQLGQGRRYPFSNHQCTRALRPYPVLTVGIRSFLCSSPPRRSAFSSLDASCSRTSS